MGKLSIILSLFVLACESSFDERRIETDFQTEFPTYLFISANINKTSDTVYAEVKFRKPHNNQTWIDKWKYSFVNNKWILFQTGKDRIITPIYPLTDYNIATAFKLLESRFIKIDSILFSNDTLSFELDVVTALIYHGDTLKQLTYIPEGDSVSIVYQRHLGNLNSMSYK